MSTTESAPPILPPSLLQSLAGTLVRDLMTVDGRPNVDFGKPAGEAALVPPRSVSWRVFKNPVALFVGGVAAVILELAEPHVRAGVWQFTGF
ncbi:MAG TPA: oxygenase MpaB family protein, partial [Pseudolabrys sp.]|nr:oxygenase MpaB family protein [Pseudolabrys sp.]